ncbi:hypothetical protein COT94_01910 [Candidatus Falkowbacteria bacterium CG10_big_fil_rev_8_21_14_0_10_37_14]|uniref:Uncharacterized protein n=1 Tax=Candidatus Falkowbacteria bacterium CG10_big_fil_rev_8_21_14_0_10_37_14 TaxID=1974561 RepID=A0A2M6WT70_9BACT|nr:hypothetical protein [Candidatus Falkowbacteria bacterium]PIT95999.1 MAG: hypothetical protein COT94_01910 [Candidatus Falkowbacteria bacterium CG10_big_fil_rev_8_21_14_0_10_37_14]
MKQENKPLWFKRKTYGWGWTPITWQGWLVVVVAIVLIIVGGYVGDTDDAPGATFLGAMLAIVVMFIFGYWKGERPRWQWGNDYKK